MESSMAPARRRKMSVVTAESCTAAGGIQARAMADALIELVRLMEAG
jgi:nicotinamide mononucleotide (NMN) deamidase PncC